MSVMEGWIKKPLSEVADITMGQSPDSKFYSEEEVGMPFLQGCAEFGSKSPFPKINCTQIKKVGKVGSILFSVRAPVGKTNLADRDYIIGRGLASILATDVDSAYLEQFIAYVEPQFRIASQGSTFEAINTKELSAWPIGFPYDPVEQTQIATILSTLDRAIEQTEAIIVKQQRVKAGLMQDLLTKGIDENGVIRSEDIHKFKDSPLGRIPVEWEVERLEALTTKIVDGVHHTPKYLSEGIPFITITDITAGEGISFENVRFISPADHAIFVKRADPRPGDVLVTKDGTLGVARVVTTDGPEFSIFVSVAQIRPKKDVCTPELIWSFFESGEFRIQLGGLSAGTGLAHIHLEHFREFKLRRPPYEEQLRIFDFITKQYSVLSENMTSLRKLHSQKRGLMHDLLTGTVRVANH